MTASVKCVVLAGALLSVVLGVGRLAPIATAAEPTTQPAKRTPMQIMGELGAASREIRGVFGSPEALFDEAKRAEAAPKAIPPMKKMLGLIDELIEVEPMAKTQLVMARMQFLALLSLMGDADAAAALEQGGKGTDAAEAATFKGTQLLVRWWKSTKDAAEQGKVVDEVQTLAKANAENDHLTQMMLIMARNGASNADLQARLEKIITEEMKSETALQIAEDMRAAQKLQSLEGKPLTIEGVKLDGTKFSTADWKGKVILVDFWATWCGPCLQELPRVKKVYAEYHDKGLEILGVSCDQKGDDLAKFLAENPDMPWPQLFDKSKPGWHALAKEYGINGIPTMFLIDKKGVVRSVEARMNFEEMIPKLLEEK